MTTTIQKVVPSDVTGYTKTVKFNSLNLMNNRASASFSYLYTDANGLNVTIQGKPGKNIQITDDVYQQLITALTTTVESIIDSL